MAKYNGRTYIRQLAHLKEGYKGKNDSGGRKCIMAQSAEYKRGEGVARQWGMLREGTLNFEYEVPFDGLLSAAYVFPYEEAA